MPYGTQATVKVNTEGVEKTVKQLEKIEKTTDEINKKKVSVGIEGLDKLSLEELQHLLKNAKGLGIERFSPDILEEIGKRQTISPEVTEGISSAIAKQADTLLSKMNWKAIGGGLLGLRSAYYFIKQIAARNENLTAAVQYLMDAIASFLEPVLNWIASMIASVAKFLGGISKGVKTTAKAAQRQLASFDEINNLTTKDGSGGKVPKPSEFIDGFLVLLKGLLELIAGLIATLFYGPIMLVQTGLAGIAAAIGGVFSLVSGLFTGISLGLYGLVEGFVTGFKTSIEAGKGFFRSVADGFISGLLNAANKFIKGFKEGFLNVWKWFDEKLITPIMTAVSNVWTKAVKPALQMILNGLGKIVNGFVGMVNSVITVLNKLGLGLGYLPRWNVPTLASGGLVDKGQLFVANENGAELIGNMGNKTAVANNEQIIEGIRRGVEEAMQNSNQTIQLVVDGTVLSSIVVNNIRRQSRVMGRSVI